MKTKFILGLATMAVAVASCTNDEVVNSIENAKQTPIGFGTYVNGTRAEAYAVGDVTTALMKSSTEGFGVVGYKNNGAIYLGVEATDESATAAIQQKWNGSTWEYGTPSELSFWPEGSNMDFYAYFPYASTTSVKIASANGENSTPLEITSWADGQDVLVASNVDLAANTAERIPLTFAHAFAKIKAVTVIQDKDGAIKDYEIIVHSISFLNTATKGNIKVANGGAISYENSNTVRSFSFQSEKTVGKTTGSSPETTTNLIEDSNNAYIFPASSIWDGSIEGIPDGKTLAMAEMVVMVLEAKVFFWSQNPADGDYKVGSSSNYGKIYIPLNLTIPEEKSSASIVAGKRYTFNITMKDNVGYKDNGSPIFSKPIKFNASVNDWETDITVDITL